ncbi:hypothetical protein [Paraburkholderia bannensis]|uniref:hypothetical protein n=1 Tax=Paraburkholderia bannensis TaxID=765414 RepID=UPI002AB7EAEF|nr:hypothetical protein [Paraburkholderia bannensis]
MEFALLTQLEGGISAASGVLYDPLPVTPFGSKALTVKALLTFSALKVGHGKQAYVYTGVLATAHSAIDDGTFSY